MTHLIIKNTEKVREGLKVHGFELCICCSRYFAYNDVILYKIESDKTIHACSSVLNEEGWGLPLAIEEIGINNIFDCGEDVELFLSKLDK